jgi:hypothetical protein
MILGMSLSAFTMTHVVISIIGILVGLIVVGSMLRAALPHRLTAAFLITTLATSATGFLFPFHGFTPALGVGIVSVFILMVAAAALYRKSWNSSWRRVYVVSAVAALYFNVFVLVAQAFQKIPALKALAPTGSEPPFIIAQLVLLAVFCVIGLQTLKRFHPQPAPAVLA